MSDTGAELIVYHTADIHSRVGFGARLARLIEPQALLVDCGDALAGSSTIYRKHEPVIDDLRAAPYTALAVGNREFHYLHGAFARRAQALPAPLVCSNLVDLWQRPAPFVRSLDVTAGSLRVRILALLVPQYRTGSGWEKIFGWRFLSPDAALGEAQTAVDGGSDAIILLSHLGLAADRAIAQRWTFLSAIIGGHSHDLLAQPEIVAGIPIVHAGAFAQYAGRLAIRIDSGKMRSFRYALLPLLAQQSA